MGQDNEATIEREPAGRVLAAAICLIAKEIEQTRKINEETLAILENLRRRQAEAKERYASSPKS